MRSKYYLRNEGLLLSMHSPYQWALDQIFAAGEISFNDGACYICYGEHVATAAYEPGTGVDWEDVFYPYSTGVPGPQGNPGGAMVWHGAYDAGHAYIIGDGALSSEGRGCVALQNTTGNAPPSYPTTANTHWSVFAEKGGSDASTLSGATLSTDVVADPGVDTKIPTEQAVREALVSAHWHAIAAAAYTSTPASTSTLTMGTDLTSTILVGYGLRYTIGGVVYYGVVTAIASNLLTIAGASLSGSVSNLSWCDPARIVQVDFFISGSFADASNTGLLASDAHTKFRWSLVRAYLVKIIHTVRVADTGANQPRATLSVNGSVVGTDNSNAGLPVAVTWTPTVVGINTSNYDILHGEAIEVVTDANGSNDNASDLTISGIFVIP
jgi:hypothetical protein